MNREKIEDFLKDLEAHLEAEPDHQIVYLMAATMKESGKAAFLEHAYGDGEFREVLFDMLRRRHNEADEADEKEPVAH